MHFYNIKNWHNIRAKYFWKKKNPQNFMESVKYAHQDVVETSTSLWHIWNIDVLKIELHEVLLYFQSKIINH